ncbi:transposable element Tcb2 transposase [Trichonephila clavipes]|nr:transposable element Tcb2 transposase [Trichonephila clavipes]
MAPIVRHNVESVREEYTRNGKKEPLPPKQHHRTQLSRWGRIAHLEWNCTGLQNRSACSKRDHDKPNLSEHHSGTTLLKTIRGAHDFNKINSPSKQNRECYAAAKTVALGNMTNVSSQIVRNRLHEGRLYVRRPMVYIPLTPHHRAARRRWTAEHRNWEQHDWSQVLFTDESRFSLECDTRRVLVWRDRGTRNNPAFVRERSQYRRAGWMVWGGISIGGRTDLHIIRNGTLTGRRYADEILLPHVIPYAGAIGDSFVFQDDNARPHGARLVENMLEAETIQRMEWPACSPDLNPIEHVWDMLGRRIAAQPRPPATVRDLEIALLEEWNSIPQSLIDNLIASMTNRCAAVLAVRGDHTPY